MSRIVAIVVFYVSTMLYGEREREREGQHTKNVANQPKVKILIFFICYSYFTHTIYMFLQISIIYVRRFATSLATTSITKATNWLPLCASDKSK